MNYVLINSFQDAHRKRSELVTVLLERLAWHEMSAVVVQMVAEAACADGLDHSDVSLLSSIGNDGKSPNHCNRDLLKKLDALDTDLPASRVEVSYINLKGERNVVLQTQASVI